MGAVYSDRELSDFFDYLYGLLQNGVIQHRYINREICSVFSKASDHVGAPTSKRSPQQASFRRDLTMICEAAAVANAHVVLTDDQRFIQNMIKYEPVYHTLVKAIERVFNIQFTLYIRPLADVIPDLNFID